MPMTEFVLPIIIYCGVFFVVLFFIGVASGR